MRRQPRGPDHGADRSRHLGRFKARVAAVPSAREGQGGGGDEGAGRNPGSAGRHNAAPFRRRATVHWKVGSRRSARWAMRWFRLSSRPISRGRGRRSGPRLRAGYRVRCRGNREKLDAAALVIARRQSTRSRHSIGRSNSRRCSRARTVVSTRSSEIRLSWAASDLQQNYGNAYSRLGCRRMHQDSHGNADLVAHFFRRAFELLRQGGVPRA